MKRIGYIFLIALTIYSCQNQSKVQAESSVAVNDSIQQGAIEAGVKEQTDEEAILKITEPYYMMALDSVKSPIKDINRYHLKSFTRLRSNQTHFKYYLLSEVSISKDFKSYVIAEDYESENACWLANYTLKRDFIDALEVYYDNAEGSWGTTSRISQHGKQVMSRIYDGYATPNVSIEYWVIDDQGKFTKEKSPVMRNVGQLIDTKESGMNLIKSWLKGSVNDVQILPRDKTKAEKALYNTQVTTRSPMGAIIYETGGILVKGGWIRILGSGGNDHLNRSLPDWNKGKTFKEFGDRPSYVLIADDIWGGLFAVNGGGLSIDDLGKVFRFSPDTREWNSMGKSYSEFIVWCFQTDLNKRYKRFLEGKYKNLPKNISGDEAVILASWLVSEDEKETDNDDLQVVPMEDAWELFMNN